MPLLLWCAAHAESRRELLVAVSVNGKPAGDFLPIVQDGQEYYAPADLFSETRLRLPAVEPLRLSGREYYRLRAIPGLTCEFDAAAQELRLTVPAEAYLSSALDGMERESAQPQPPGVGLFLNHDMQFASYSGSRSLAGVAEAGLFSNLGVLTARMMAPDLLRSGHAVRMDTQFRRDFPDRMTALTIGDSISAPAPWARQVYYAGISWSRKFGAQPSFIPRALPSVEGQAVLPSTVDVYVDNVRTLHQQVPPGPFSIRNVPVLTDQGTIRMVVRDALGREYITSGSYISAPALLRRGVSEFTYEAGSFRYDYSMRSASYRSVFAAATHRRGITDSLTVSGRAEAQGAGTTAGLGADLGFRRIGVLMAGAAASAGGGAPGHLVYGGLSHRTRATSIFGYAQFATSSFRQVGLAAKQEPTRKLLQGNLSQALGSRATLGIGYMRRVEPSAVSVNAVLFSATARAGRATLSATANYSLDRGSPFTLSLALILPSGERRMASATTDLQTGSNTTSVQFEQQLPVGSGVGYRARVSRAEQSTTVQMADGAVLAQNSGGTYSAEFSRIGRQSSWRASRQGSLVFYGGHMFASRWLTDSFAVIELPLAVRTPVYANNQLIAETGGNGTALIPWLVPYERNLIHLDDTGLPLDVQIDSVDRSVVPFPRSGVLVRYEAEQITGALVSLVDETGAPLPAGASAKLEGDSGEYLLGLRGQLFLPNLKGATIATITLDKGSCRAAIPDVSKRRPLPHIGPLVCERNSK